MTEEHEHKIASECQCILCIYIEQHIFKSEAMSQQSFKMCNIVNQPDWTKDKGRWAATFFFFIVFLSNCSTLSNLISDRNIAVLYYVNPSVPRYYPEIWQEMTQLFTAGSFMNSNVDINLSVY